VQPLPLLTIAEASGLLPSELLPWGRHKAKVDSAAVMRRLAKSVPQTCRSQLGAPQAVRTCVRARVVVCTASARLPAPLQSRLRGARGDGARCPLHCRWPPLGASEDGALIVVVGINPTPLGEGKSTTTIGLVQVE
jgi:hypothetical protein